MGGLSQTELSAKEPSNPRMKSMIGIRLLPSLSPQDHDQEWKPVRFTADVEEDGR